MIVLEGCDLTGKTTLAEYLSRRFAVPYVHMSAPDERGDWAQATRILSEFEHRNDLVFDRLVISNYAYAPIWPSQKPNTFLNLLTFMAYLRHTDSVLIHADAPDDVILARYAANGDEAEQINPTTLIDTARRYRRFFDAIRDANAARVLTYDSSRCTPEHFLDAHCDDLLAAISYPKVPRTMREVEKEVATKVATEKEIPVYVDVILPR